VNITTIVVMLAVTVSGVLCAAAETGQKATAGENLSRGRLVAWCVVPFDAKNRGPRQRAEMLRRLGIKRLAYDWRTQHVPTFEREIIATRAHGIEFFAFWGEHDRMFELFRKHKITPQVWKSLPSPSSPSQARKVEAAARAMLPLVARTRKLGCKLGLYNHGGWGGEPDNMVAVCKWLRQNADAGHVGIVYNFHHAHGHIADFKEALAAMKPYLLCLNLNGMNDGAKPKILPVGRGKHDKEMIRAVIASGYAGPVGIIGHDKSLDVEQRLKDNVEGLEAVLAQLAGKAPPGGTKPTSPAGDPRVVQLTVADVRDVKGDGPDGKGNTADDTWGFWFELVHSRGKYARLDLATEKMSAAQRANGIGGKVTGPIGGWLPNPKDTEGWVFHRDWDGRFEGIWGDKKADQVIMCPYVEKGSHAAVALTYAVRATGTYTISGKVTDLQVHPQFRKHDGVLWKLEIADGGGRGKLIAKGGPIGDARGRPDSADLKVRKVSIERGKLLRLVIHPNKWWGSDMTAVQLRIERITK